MESRRVAEFAIEAEQIIESTDELVVNLNRRIKTEEYFDLF